MRLINENHRTLAAGVIGDIISTDDKILEDNLLGAQRAVADAIGRTNNFICLGDKGNARDVEDTEILHLGLCAILGQGGNFGDEIVLGEKPFSEPHYTAWLRQRWPDFLRGSDLRERVAKELYELLDELAEADPMNVTQIHTATREEVEALLRRVNSRGETTTPTFDELIRHSAYCSAGSVDTDIVQISIPMKELEARLARANCWGGAFDTPILTPVATGENLVEIAGEMFRRAKPEDRLLEKFGDHVVSMMMNGVPTNLGDNRFYGPVKPGGVLSKEGFIAEDFGLSREDLIVAQAAAKAGIKSQSKIQKHDVALRFIPSGIIDRYGNGANGADPFRFVEARRTGQNVIDLNTAVAILTDSRFLERFSFKRGFLHDVVVNHVLPTGEFISISFMGNYGRFSTRRFDHSNCLRHTLQSSTIPVI